MLNLYLYFCGFLSFHLSIYLLRTYLLTCIGRSTVTLYAYSRSRYSSLVKDAYTGFCDIILKGSQERFASRLYTADKSIRRPLLMGRLIGIFPKYLLELGVILSFLVFSVVVLIFGRSISLVTNFLVFLFLLVQRLLPAFNTIYNNYSGR